MKRILVAIFSLLATSCFCQETEFGKSENGLIYSDATIKQLKFIVDSLNLRFRVCDLSKTYLSKFQTRAHYLSLESGKIKAAIKDLEANISFNDFIKRFGKSKVEKELLVVKFKYKNYDEKDVVEFSSIEVGNKYEHELEFDKNLEKYDEPLKGKWIFKYYAKTQYTKESLEAFYFLENFSQQSIPEIYARMIQYSDCMVDTSTQIFFDEARSSGVLYANEVPSKSQEFLDYVHKSTNRPDYKGNYSDNDYELYFDQYRLWDSLRISKIDSIRNKEEKFNKLLVEAVGEAIRVGGTDDEFEEYVGRYYSKKTALELKRNRRVIGGCSMDISPRVHALNIAKLSAETINWEIFLRSHLDIMNDRFQRASDGSYAWQQRKTYIRELEILDINVLDLLLGITLRIENPSQNHYFGSVGRLGRALSETTKSSDIETKMLQMISDNRLDDYNRMLIYYLFLNYSYSLPDKQKQTDHKVKLLNAGSALPAYLSTKIVAEK